MKKLLGILSSVLMISSFNSIVVSCSSNTITVSPSKTFTLENANVYQAEAGNYHKFMIAQPKFPDYKVGSLQLKAILKDEKTKKIINPRIASIDVSQDGWQIYVSFYDPIQLSDGILDLSFELISINNETDGLEGIGSFTNDLKLANYSIDIDKNYPTMSDDPDSSIGVTLAVTLSPSGEIKYSSDKNAEQGYDVLPEWDTFRVWVNGKEKKVIEAYVPYDGSTTIGLKIDTNQRIVPNDVIKVEYTWPNTKKVVSKTITYVF